MNTDQKDSANSTDSNTEKIFRSNLYPALTRFFKAKAYNYLPYVYCPNCGEPEHKEMDKRHVYLCSSCGGEYYWSYYDKVMFIQKESYDLFDCEDEISDRVPHIP